MKKLLFFTFIFFGFFSFQFFDVQAVNYLNTNFCPFDYDERIDFGLPSNQKTGIQFSVNGDSILSEVKVKLTKFGLPADSVVAGVYNGFYQQIATSTNSISNAVIEVLPTYTDFKSFYFDNVSLNSAGIYYLVIQRTGALDWNGYATFGKFYTNFSVDSCDFPFGKIVKNISGSWYDSIINPTTANTYSQMYIIISADYGDMYIFNYLGQFWDSITDSIIGGTTYTISWFQQIGNAVAGAIGNIFLIPLKVLVEFGLLISYIFNNLVNIVINVLAPFKFLAVFFSSFLDSLFSAPTGTGNFVFDINAMAVVAGIIPFWTTISAVIVGIIVIGGVLSTIKSINL